MTLVPASSHGSAFSLPTGFTFPDTDASVKLNNGYETYLDVHDSSTGGDVSLDSKYGVQIAPSFTGAECLAVAAKAGATARALKVLGGTGATADVAAFIGDNGEVWVNSLGSLLLDRADLPASAELTAGQVTLWFDTTSGAAALGIKAKDAGGTVRTSKYPVRQGSGALSTVAPVSATAFQCSATQDVFLTVPVTYNPGVATTATCKVELSPDNSTFSELVTITQPVGTVFDGSIEAVQLVVPAAWRVKLTVVNATLGTGTYY